MASFRAIPKLIPYLSTVFVICLCACAEMYTDSTGAASETQAEGASGGAPPLRVPVRELERDRANNMEIIWQTGDDQADAFIIRYGTNPHSLSEEKRVDASSIEKFNDRDFGLVYRYILRNLPPGRDIFVSVASVHGGAISEPSSIFAVKAEDTARTSPESEKEAPTL